MFAENTRILVIDDMKTMRMVMKKTLKQLGFSNIEEADDGDTAWPMIEQSFNSGTPFQLIMSDWNMPKLSGIDLLRKVRAEPRMAALPFVLVTAESEKAQIMEAIKAGVSQYVMKPFNAETLQTKLEAVNQKMAR